MCAPHWRKVPRALQHEVYTHYIKGQELGLRRPSEAWFEAAKKAIEAVLAGDDGSGQVGLFEPGSEAG